MSRKNFPEINAGSMADIAFLLLIFFLVTTTMDTESGIPRKIPEKAMDNLIMDIHKKNILEVNLNVNNEIFVDGNIIDFNQLKEIAIDFIDNGAGVDKNNQVCDYCGGAKNPLSSDHPTKALISIQSDRNTTYETYLKTLDILNAAYTHLRNGLSVKLYGKNYETLVKEFEKSNNSDDKIFEKINVIRAKYPLLVSDTEIKN